MFSSNPFPEFPSSPNVFLPPNFFFDYEKDCVCFNYHQSSSNPLISDDCFLHSPSPVMENIPTINQDFVSQQQQFSEGPWLQSSEDHDDLLDSVISCSKSKKKTGTGTSKKDGHSKIYTAQGPRDRRVRLSMDISRKFFCLQDLLGFDKASKTLDWLFSKSNTAIKELVEETKRCSSSTATDQSKLNFLQAITGGLDDQDKGKRKKPVSKCVDGKRNNMTVKSRTGFQENFARDQSRAMARARARERTREKMHIKRLDDELKAVAPDEFNCQNLERNEGKNHKAILAAGSLLINDGLYVVNGGSGVML